MIWPWPNIRLGLIRNTACSTTWCGYQSIVGAYALNGAVKAGPEFRDRRLNQAKATGTDILSLYCPGCHMVLGSEGPNKSLRIESILSFLGESLGMRQKEGPGVLLAEKGKSFILSVDQGVA